MKVKMGMFMTDAVGKSGGQCLQRNHYGLFARNIVIPTNPQTLPQQDRRAQLEFLTFNWQLLNDDERTNWIAETANYPRTNSFGDTYYMTGQALYISLNLNLWKIGQAFISTPVTKVIPPDVGTFAPVMKGTPSAFHLHFTALPNDGDSRYIVYASASTSPGKYYVSTALRSIAVHDMDADNVYDFGPDYDNYFGGNTADQKTFVKAVSVSSRCGCMGVPFFASCINIP